METTMLRRKTGFTLVELLVVIGIITVLIGILLPTLSRAREAGNTVKCSANLHSIGQGIALYIADNRGYLPASNVYNGWQSSGGVQTPPNPINGYVHWSAFLYNGEKHLDGSDPVYKSLFGWQMFQCPSVLGLAPANTFAGNLDPGLTNEAGGSAIDLQAPRLSYALNEALTPRSRVTKGFSGANNVWYHWVQASRVQHNAETILATELWGNPYLISTNGYAGGTVSNSRRPVSGYKLSSSPAGNADKLYTAPSLSAVVPAVVSDLQPDPSVYYLGQVPPKAITSLDFVGRNHGGSKKLGGYTPDPSHPSPGQWDLRRSNFLYVDGHVETKFVGDTVYPKNQWGDQFYTFAN